MDLATVLPLSVAGAALVLVLVILVVLLAARPARRRLERDLAATRADLASVQGRLDELEAAAATDVPDAGAPAVRAPQEFLITDLSERPTGPAGDRLPVLAEAPLPTAGAFVSLAAGETLVKAAALGHGLRRALSPESRNRLRFALRQEVKRSRRQRRREARRRVRVADAGPAGRHRQEDAA